MGRQSTTLCRLHFVFSSRHDPSSIHFQGFKNSCANLVWLAFSFIVWNSENPLNTYSTFLPIPPVSKILSEVCPPRHCNRRPCSYQLGILHTIFFHRYFPSIRPSSIEVLDLTLPLVADPELETLIDTRVGQLIRQLSSTSSPKSSVRGSLVVQFFEKKRRKGGGLGWFTGGVKGDEEVCWESWCLEVTLATPKTEIGGPTTPTSLRRIPHC